MAPDLGSLPASPRLDRASHPSSQTVSNAASRRTSQIMGPPQQPASATTHGQNATRSPTMSSNENVPMRHPRPLTAAELYLECEKEQEAVVNRLTRELTALRAQSASVASNASSASAASLLPVDISDPNPTHQMVGATHPTPSRRHRSSSSVSGRSISTPATTASGVTNTSAQAQPGGSVPLSSVSQAHADRAAAANGDRSTLSRNPSISASGTSTPARQSMDVSRTPGTIYTLPHRPSLSRDPSLNTISSTHAQAGTPAPQSAHSPLQGSISTATQHYADTTAYRTEMEIVKAENEVLRQRVRALERALRTRRRDSSQSEAPRLDAHSGSTRDNMARVSELSGTTAERPSRDFNRVPSFTSPPASAALGVWDGGIGGVAGPRERSESQSTTASSRRAVGVTDDEVRVGESASSVGRHA